VVAEENHPGNQGQRITGNPINMASRFEALAKPGEILVGEETFHLAKGFFQFEPRKPGRVKGKEGLVRTYRVRGINPGANRFEIRADRGLTPLVGRKMELHLLLEAFEKVKAGEGQACSIVAEAGFGKSRLVHEFEKAIVKEEATILRGRCLSYCQGVAYYPFIDLLKSAFDIGEEDAEGEIQEKVTGRLKSMGTEAVSLSPYLLHLLSVKERGGRFLSITPEARRQLINEALKRLLWKGAETRPLIIIIEDLHWMDKSSGDSLKELLDSLIHNRIFVLLAYRPEFLPDWEDRPYHLRITLKGLPDSESLDMARHLLKKEPIDPNLRTLILEKTVGNPFFIEEFIQSWREMGIIVKKRGYKLAANIRMISVPATIQEVILTRVDSLPPPAKDLLQTGSAVQGEFSREMICQVTGLPEESVTVYLDQLKHSNLLYEKKGFPQSVFVFKHSLIREVVYNSILSPRKMALHGKIARVLEGLFQNSLEEHYSLLADHFMQAGDFVRGGRYSELAAKKAQKSAFFREAIAYARAWSRCLEQLPKTTDNQRALVDARTTLAGYYMALNLHVEAKEAVIPIVELAQKLNYRERLSGIFTAIGIHSLWVLEDSNRGFRYLDRVLKISKEERDDIAHWFAHYFLGCHLSWNCEFEKSLAHLRKSLHMSQKTRNVVGIASTKSAICAHNLALVGRVRLAYKTGQEALRLADQSQDVYIQGMAHTGFGIACYLKGRWNESEDHLIKGLAFCEKTSQVTWGALAAFWLGLLYYDCNDVVQAQNHHQKSVAILKNAGMSPSWINVQRCCLLRAQGVRNDQSSARENLSGYFERNQLKICTGWIARFIGEIYLCRGGRSLDKAEGWIRKAAAFNKKHGLPWFLGQDLVVYSEIRKKRGDRRGALEKLDQAIHLLQDCGADGHLPRLREKRTLLQ
jgi:tetratricopeptide (TPR) repeat protein